MLSMLCAKETPSGKEQEAETQHYCKIQCLCSTDSIIQFSAEAINISATVTTRSYRASARDCISLPMLCADTCGLKVSTPHSKQQETED